MVRRFLKENDVNRIELPSKSPDLNPIENIWTYLQNLITKRATPTENLATLGQYLLDEWDGIPMDVISNTVKTMGSRIDAVFAARGCITQYWVLVNLLVDVL